MLDDDDKHYERQLMDLFLIAMGLIIWLFFIPTDSLYINDHFF